jgi:MoxR-like ATPase
MANWGVYHGPGTQRRREDPWPEPPPWRVFDKHAEPVRSVPKQTDREIRRAAAYLPDDPTKELVNAALYLRRPLLVSGPPGSGKSSLAYSVAYELRLGRVLHWPITSRVTVNDGLYRYDPLGRLYTASRPSVDGGEQSDGTAPAEDIGRYIRLGPLGTALLPWRRPRVLLIDEIDKSDLDLPNDLLTLFEDGEYPIQELVRQADPTAPVEVFTADDTRVPITRGRVRCREFPFVVMTSNNEREFPPAFLRRCIQIKMGEPDEEKLAEIVRSHLTNLADSSEDLIRRFLELREPSKLATDQLLNAIFLVDAAARDGNDRLKLAEKIMAPLAPQHDLDDEHDDY